MNHQEFMRYLRDQSPEYIDDKVTPRAYKNASGVDEIIHLHESYWDYMGWLEETTEIKFADWVVHCDKNPAKDHTLSHILMYWLWLDECNRFRNGMPTPNSTPPMGYLAATEPVNDA